MQMNTLVFIELIILGVLLWRSALDLIAIRSNIHWLRKSQRALSGPPTTRFIICIPVLYEQDVITQTLTRMLTLDYPKELVTIYVVTTRKESRQGNSPTTREVVTQYSGSLSPEDKQRMQVLTYPSKEGRMAHQINFVADHVANELRSENCYFVVYNADSVVQPDALRVADGAVRDIHRRTHTYPSIMQQSAIYSYQGTAGRFESSIAKGAAMHQSRWTLTHEISRLRKQSRSIKKLNSGAVLSSIFHAKIAHCVGHGLFIQGMHYIEHPLPSDVLNEDLPYGLMQCALRKEIYPLPTLELATSPARLTNVYKQKAVWFNPMFEFHTCIKTLLASGNYVSRFEVYILAMQAYATMLVWLAHSLFWNVGLVLSIVLGWKFFALWLIALVCYWVIPSFLYHRYAKEEGLYSCFTLASLAAGSLYVLSHSAGPLLCSLRWIKARSAGMQPDKPKTVSN